MTPPTLVSLHRRVKPSLIPDSARIKLVKPTPERPLIISASELRDFLQCRVKWWWRYQARLEPKAGGEALYFGTVVHNILEQWYKLPLRKRTIKAMTKIAEATVSGTTPKQLTFDDLQLIRAMLIGYASWAEDRDAEDGVGECMPEEWFDLPLSKDGAIRIRGKIDNTFFPTTLKKTVACHEFKSKSQIKMDVVEMNLQLSVYLWALRQKYPKMKSFIAHYTVLRKQMPGPRVRADLFAREAVERTDEEIDQWARDTERAALDMLDAAIYANPTDACSWSCDFKMPCLLRGNKDDLLHVLETEYQPKEYRA